MLWVLHVSAKEIAIQRGILLTALKEIASRGPLPGYETANALRLRLVLTQAIARTAIAKTKGTNE